MLMMVCIWVVKEVGGSKIPPVLLADYTPGPTLMNGNGTGLVGEFVGLVVAILS